MKAEIRVGASGLPDEEWQKLPFLLKWVRMGMAEEVGDLRVAEGGEAVDCLLVDMDQGRTTEPGGTGKGEIPVARDPARLPDPQVGLTYPLRVADLQKRLEAVIASSPGSAAVGSVPSGRTGRETEDPGGNPEPGPAAANVERLVAPLLEPDPGSVLCLQVGQGVGLVVSPERGYQCPLAPGEFGWLQDDLATAQWRILDEEPAANPHSWKPLPQLIWLLAFYGARDGLLPRIPRDRVFTLASWPDFQVVPVAANRLRFWAYLTSNAADVATIAAATGLDQREVLGSLNAGHLCGLVRVRVAKETVSGPKGKADKGLLGKIRQRLGLSSAPSG